MSAPTAGLATPDAWVIDLHFQDQPGVIASYVLDTGDGLALVDVGPGSTLGALEAGLSERGASLSDVRHVLLTHIHLDHAGAAGTVLERVPRARAYVHERGAAHLSRPSRLLASAAQIYGDQMERLWGEMRPIDQGRLTVLSGGEGLRLGHLEGEALYTPGHAVHHLAYHLGDDLFVGDVGGIRLDARQTPRAPTPPPDIDLPAWRRSVEVLRARDARTLALAHFGTFRQEAAHWDGLLSTLDQDAAVVREGLEAGQAPEEITERFTEHLFADLEAEAPGLPGRFGFACPPWMSVQGLARYWGRAAVRGGAERRQDGTD
ncbi:glyoxylase-like metal-dependent hydrolase (beta-lactamase superfamily II) [Deinococcus sp. HSC-46F16]|uniref:MBL fold metallo-hydrolase n=1 Tax=Deinococcus sp. HSC-46F16 TaxID=2910968 RepID=UPI00209CEF6F|nr:MBL fold metallo-hydrolase [Deinococcus sp. HSC-46F16]MCP2013029.1 glyoxylase-like metal-dependent hydrolase (beta-lactamase superfamily II) [Deinococcus sp. HSC-46F16]